MTRRFFVLVSCAGLAVAGCGPARTGSPISGVVRLDGVPLADGDITFVPVAGSLAPGGGKVVAGAYSVELQDGAYTVKITATKEVPLGPGEPSVSGEKTKRVQVIPARYNAKTELPATVAGATKLDFALVSKPK